MRQTLKSKEIGQSTPLREYINLQRYHKNKPSILNSYFGINLISVVDKLPPLANIIQPVTEINLLDNRTQARGAADSLQTQIQNKVDAYRHQINKLNEDIQINEYTITNVLLGRGAHSTVKMAKKDDKFYAIKILWLDKIKKKYFIKQKQLVNMINSEINLLLSLKHANIVQFIQAIYAHEKERMFIVLEYCHKGSLAHLINTNITTENDIWFKLVKDYFKQIVTAISFLHSNNIIHRDIKPENLLITEQYVIKIIDFNISQKLKGDGMIKISNKFIGTKGYAAPQLLLNLEKEKIMDGKSIDIWALGITLLELLQRKHPFNLKSIDQLHKFLSKQVQIEKDVPKQAQDLLRQMLKLKNQERISIQSIKKHPWLK